MTNELIKLDEKDIENKIYEIRGVQVMLDSDLAELYQCKNGTKSINLAVKRHINRFPERFMFQLTKVEYNNLRFQIETTNMSRTLPYAFTEQGVAMLASVLKTKVAEEVSVKIMDAFVKMRHFIIENKDIYKSLNNINIKLIEHDEKINKIFNRFEPKEKLYLKGQIYDAYSKIIDIFNLAKKELIIIDSYADKTLLDMISKLKLIRNNTFHDRYFIVDKEEIYHCRSSINSAGNGTFSINKLEDEFIIKILLNKIGGIINGK